MNLTPEQQRIIASTGNIKINAVAGSGKTTTIVEYARTRPAKSKILYIAFNKSVKLEAVRKFEKSGLKNVKVETAHSLAFKHIVFKHRYKVRPQGYKINEIAQLLKIKSNGEKHGEYVVANHIGKYIAYFCNSDKQTLAELNYLDIVAGTAKDFVRTHYRFIQKQTSLFLSKMDKGEIEISHDFYVKKFQLTAPQLGYDYILFDEGQDASPAMLDIFLKQKAIKVIVGDTHQQIYSWRFAVNALEQVKFPTYNLSVSFRFGQDIAALAMEILQFKKRTGSDQQLWITGSGKSKSHEVKATVARTNLGLLLKAIEYVKEKENTRQIYFEGNINSYTYADDGASLYDILNLYNGKHHLIKDQLIRSMRNLDDLEEYVEKTEDAQLGMMLEIVKEYGNEIHGILHTIKQKHVKNDEKENAEMIFSTVHRCKGMEYDSIQLANDFISFEKLEKLRADDKKDGAQLKKLVEEINLLYVAITRAKTRLYIPEKMISPDFPISPNITVLKSIKEPIPEPLDLPLQTIDEDLDEQNIIEADFAKRAIFEEELREAQLAAGEDSNEVKKKAYTVAGMREKNKSAYAPWTTEDDQLLTQLYGEGITAKDMAKHFGRSRGAIYSRIKKLELELLYR